MEIIFKVFGKLFLGTLSEVAPFWFLLAFIGFGLLCFAIYGIWNADKYAKIDKIKQDQSTDSNK